jgi:anaerobic magnesium-protoporphyrin IX monomethyl ester cyclase
MRVCLINPPRIHPKLWGKPSVFQPLEIAYIAAVLEQRGHKVCIIDAPTEGWRNLQDIGGLKYRQGLSNEEIAQKVKEYAPDVVGVTVPFSGWWISINEVISSVKGVNKDITTVLTGLHPTVRPKECLADRNIDFVVIGEPEQTMSELVDTLESKRSDVDKVRGIGYLKDGKTTLTSPRPLLENLDVLPFPARHLLPMKEYFEAVKEVPLRGEINKPWSMIITSRGCPHQCVFCTIHNVMGRTWRARSPRNVVDEIEQLIKTYHVKQIDFFDDNMTLDKKRAAAIFDQIVQRKLDIEWYTPNGVRADTLDEPLLQKMKASGCRKIRLAPESGVQRVVDQVIKKNQNLQDVETAIVLAKKVRIKVGCFFVMGLIGETKEEMNQTIAYAYKLRKLGADRFYFSIAMPVYGTELYNQAVKGGYLKTEFSDSALAEVEPLIETSDFTADEVRELCAKAHLINHAITSDKVVLAIRNPKKALKFLLGKQ